ncbi:hypothetical protein CEXT_221731 [Caerostris extrusa]|uniref:Uncharacterized protein n=1 Tax=Caerostris extrusa TaxID=172846 RepID=A0AAV4PCG7_CAEEX|nr:hypothetical protein CEXT_221731 [Caerostris extrusa]
MTLIPGDPARASEIEDGRCRSLPFPVLPQWNSSTPPAPPLMFVRTPQYPATEDCNQPNKETQNKVKKERKKENITTKDEEKKK